MDLPDYEKLGAFYLGKRYDAERGAPLEELLLYASKDLTTHAVCVGMTGSGKTGLCLSLLEEAALDGIPALAIDPKGDLANLLLTFPDLAARDFRPWIDEGEAARQGATPDAYAEQVAGRWREGLAAWGQDGERIRRLRAAADFAIYTPGSSAGRPLSVLRSFDAPPEALRADADALRERVASAVSGLLTLLGVAADPIRSREHILLSNLLDRAWRQGNDLGLPALIGAIQHPGFERVGALDLESVYPEKDRFELAIALNNLLASPNFASWMEGDPLDVRRLLHGDDGRPRVTILSIAHLSDAERMFFVTLLLNEVVAWMRTQPGTPSLRALLYMDEVFGYFPPSANPPSKTPMLTLLKQARAYGLGCVLATQNPVDLDYKGLSNAGTWFLGRLQTERDKARVLDGLEGAASVGGGGFDRARTEAILSGLASRVFLMHNVHDDAPLLFHTRWAMSYLRGPLTRVQIQRLCDAAPAPAPAPEAPVADAVAPAATRDAATSGRPVVAPGVRQGFLDADLPLPEKASLLYRPALVGAAQLHFANAARGVDVWRPVWALALLDAGRVASDPWSDARWVEAELPRLPAEPEPGAGYGELPAAAAKPASYPLWQKRFESAVYKRHTLALWECAKPRARSVPEESEGDFRARLADLSREARDDATEKLRKRYAPKLRQLQERLRRAEEKIGREQDQLTAQKQSAMISVGTTVLGALFGRKAASVGTAGRIGTTLSRGSRIAKEKEDVARAMRDAETTREQLAELEAEFADEVAELEVRPDPACFELKPCPLRPRKTDIAVEPVTLVWTPWALGPDGRATALFEL